MYLSQFLCKFILLDYSFKIDTFIVYFLKMYHLSFYIFFSKSWNDLLHGTFEICRYNIEEVRSCLAITTIDHEWTKIGKFRPLCGYGWTRIGKFRPVWGKMVICLCLLLVSSSIKWDRSFLVFKSVVFFHSFFSSTKAFSKRIQLSLKIRNQYKYI